MLDPLVSGMDGGFAPGGLQIDDLIQRDRPAAHSQDRMLRADVPLFPIPVQGGGQARLIHRLEQVFQRIGGKAVQGKTGVVCDVDDGGVDLLFPEEAGQLHAVVPLQLDVQQQELIGVRVSRQPLHQRRGGVEYLHIVVPPPCAASPLQDAAGGGFILFCGAGIVFTYGDTVHEATSRVLGTFCKVIIAHPPQNDYSGQRCDLSIFYVSP